MCLGSVDMSVVYTLKTVGERTSPCGALILNWCCVDVMFIKDV